MEFEKEYQKQTGHSPPPEWKKLADDKKVNLQDIEEVTRFIGFLGRLFDSEMEPEWEIE